VWCFVACVLIFTGYGIIVGGGVWCGGVIMLEICVPWLEVIGYVWFNVSSNWLQVVCGRVLFGESM
jgi:hypothetical protein